MNSSANWRLAHARMYATQCLHDEARAIEDLVSQLDENFDRASRGNAMWRLGHVLSQARLNLVHAIRDVKHEPSPYAHPSYDE